MSIPVTPEFPIAVSSGSNDPTPRLAVLRDGRLVATWYDIGSDDVRHRFIDFDGALIGSEQVTPALPALSQSDASVAALADGGFVIVWQDFSGDTAGDVRFRVFGADGSAVRTGLLTEGSSSTGRQATPAVTGTADGGFLVAWSDRNPATTGLGPTADAVMVRGFSSDGLAVGPIRRLSGDIGGDTSPALALRGTTIQAVWDDNGGSSVAGNELDGIYWRPVSLPLPPSNPTDGGTKVSLAANIEAAARPDIASTAAGTVIVWTEGTSVYMRIVDGPAAGDMRTIITSAFAQGEARVAALPFGGFVVTWHEFRNQTGNFTSFDVFAQVFGANGQTVGSPVSITPNQPGAEFDPEVIGLIDGRYMVSWSSQGTLGDVIGRIYDPRTAAISWTGNAWGERFAGTDLAAQNDTLMAGGGDDLVRAQAGNDIVTGGEGNDTLGGDAGNDALSGDDGDDQLIGGTGNDILDGGPGNDTMDGGAGNDRYLVRDSGDQVVNEIGFSQGGGIDTVESWVSHTLPRNVEILRLQGSAAINGTGNAAPEALIGNSGANVLRGEGGNDVLNGKAGNDTLEGGTGADSLVGEDGADLFVFRSVADSRAGQANRDFINGFQRGSDRIDLSAIDANSLTGANDAFAFVGSAPFSGQSGELRWFTFGGGNFLIVEADVNGDRVADVQIFVNQTSSLSAADLIL